MNTNSADTLAELQGIAADAGLALGRLKRLLQRHDVPHPVYGNAEVALDRLDDAVGYLKVTVDSAEDALASQEARRG